MKTWCYKLGIMCLLIFIAGCDSEQVYAPVVEISTVEPLPTNYIHVSDPGETLYEIAWRYGLDYREIAEINHIGFPYKIYTGQQIRLKPVGGTAYPETAHTDTVDTEPKGKWVWPAKGKVINHFSATNKGVNIAGSAGTPIYAAYAGKIVYAGDGLRGYGNLIILKHNSTYLSAYAHNKMLLVKEGQMVKAGQKIAEMGHTGTDKTVLHFEIRKAGRPINPLLLYQ